MEARKSLHWTYFGFGTSIGFSIADERWVSGIALALIWLSLIQIQDINAQRQAATGGQQ